MPSGIPGGLAAILGKLAMLTKGIAGKVPGGADAHGLKGEKAEGKGPQKGEALGEGHVLIGLGFNPADKHGPFKNLNEQANVDKFLKEMRDAPAEEGEGKQKTAGSDKADKKESEPTERNHAEAREAQETERTARKQDNADEARAQGQKETQEQKEAREQIEQPEPQHQQQDEQEEEDKPGAGWVAEEFEEEEKEQKRGLYAQDALGSEHRCRGLLEDGTRCLRKPIDGTPYCREHASVRAVDPIDTDL